MFCQTPSAQKNWRQSLVSKKNVPIRNWKLKRNIFYLIIWCISFLKTTAECRYYVKWWKLASIWPRTTNISNDNNFKRKSPPFNIKWVTLTNKEALFCCKAAASSWSTRGETRDVVECFLCFLALGTRTNLSFAFSFAICWISVYSSVTWSEILLSTCV